MRPAYHAGGVTRSAAVRNGTVGLTSVHEPCLSRQARPFRPFSESRTKIAGRSFQAPGGVADGSGNTSCPTPTGAEPNGRSEIERRGADRRIPQSWEEFARAPSRSSPPIPRCGTCTSVRLAPLTQARAGTHQPAACEVWAVNVDDSSGRVAIHLSRPATAERVVSLIRRFGAAPSVT